MIPIRPGLDPMITSREICITVDVDRQPVGTSR